eukprot:1651381-Rhodomonas_salina.1
MLPLWVSWRLPGCTVTGESEANGAACHGPSYAQYEADAYNGTHWHLVQGFTLLVRHWYPEPHRQYADMGRFFKLRAFPSHWQPQAILPQTSTVVVSHSACLSVRRPPASHCSGANFDDVPICAGRRFRVFPSHRARFSVRRCAVRVIALRQSTRKVVFIMMDQTT